VNSALGIFKTLKDELCFFGSFLKIQHTKYGRTIEVTTLLAILLIKILKQSEITGVIKCGY
jgi:hypothetical protein